MGKKIENYVLQNVIGEGQFGKVYRAINQKTSQIVAIKIIKIEKFKQSPKLEEFTINQIQTLSKIQDTTHVVRFIEILKTANNYYFVYEYCNGGTLEQLIKLEGRFSESKAIGYFRDLLKAFQILSKSNIMHRDIKPSNILLNNGIIKLADFGFCKPLKDSKDLSQTMLGSPIYMAPEVLKGEVYTMKADIWSLGVVLYEMIYGFCPFQEKTIARLISLIDETTVIFPSNIRVSKKIEDLMKKMLVKDHFKRITWEQLLNYEFEEVLSNSSGFEKNNAIPISNPFSKKNAATNIPNEQVPKNRFLNLIDPNKPQQNSFKHTKEHSQQPIGVTQLRKKQSKGQINSINTNDKKILSMCFQIRNKMSVGLRMIRELLTLNGSKLTVYMCCYLAKKVKLNSKNLSETIKKMGSQKQNERDSKCWIQTKKMMNILNQQKMKIEQKLVGFEAQLQAIHEPQDIVMLKYAQQQGLTQQKEGLVRLIQIYDYLKDQVGDYTRMSKKQLVEQYERRIMRG